MTILVTGANKGIGYEIAKKYALNKYSGDILVASRNVDLGKKAIEQLKIETNQVTDTANFVHVQLDLTDSESRKNCINFVKQSYPEGLDILINNAGFSHKGGAGVSFHQQAVETLAINYYGTKDFTLEAIQAGIIKKTGAGRILTCSSGGTDGMWKRLSKEDQEIFQNSKNLSLKDLDNMADEFINLSKNVDLNDPKDTYKLPKYVKSAYVTSKYFIRAFTAVCAVQFPEFLHYSYCPGWCRTDLASQRASRSAEEGARVAYFLGTDGSETVLKNSGSFFKNDDRMYDWGVMIGDGK